MQDISELLDQLYAWAPNNSHVLAVLLVGSYARGTAHAESDVDLVLLLENPDDYLNDDNWIDYFGQAVGVEHEDYGVVQSKRVFFTSGLEVEFTLTGAEWAATDPIDEGTEGVVANGAQILYDPHGLLDTLLWAVDGPIEDPDEDDE